MASVFILKQIEYKDLSLQRFFSGNYEICSLQLNVEQSSQKGFCDAIDFFDKYDRLMTSVSSHSTDYIKTHNTYMGAHGIAAENLLVSKNALESTRDLTRRGRCCAKS